MFPKSQATSRKSQVASRTSLYFQVFQRFVLCYVGSISIASLNCLESQHKVRQLLWCRAVDSGIVGAWLSAATRRLLNTYVTREH